MYKFIINVSTIWAVLFESTFFLKRKKKNDDFYTLENVIIRSHSQPLLHFIAFSLQLHPHDHTHRARYQRHGNHKRIRHIKLFRRDAHGPISCK